MIAIDQFVLNRLVMTSSFWPTKACIFDWLTLCRYPTSLFCLLVSFLIISHISPFCIILLECFHIASAGKMWIGWQQHGREPGQGGCGHTVATSKRLFNIFRCEIFEMKYAEIQYIVRQCCADENHRCTQNYPDDTQIINNYISIPEVKWRLAVVKRQCFDPTHATVVSYTLLHVASWRSSSVVAASWRIAGWSRCRGGYWHEPRQARSLDTSGVAELHDSWKILEDLRRS